MLTAFYVVVEAGKAFGLSDVANCDQIVSDPDVSSLRCSCRCCCVLSERFWVRSQILGALNEAYSSGLYDAGLFVVGLCEERYLDSVVRFH